MEWTKVPQDSFQRHALVNTNRLLGSIKGGKFIDHPQNQLFGSFHVYSSFSPLK